MFIQLRRGRRMNRELIKIIMYNIDLEPVITCDAMDQDEDCLNKPYVSKILTHSV